MPSGDVSIWAVIATILVPLAIAAVGFVWKRVEAVDKAAAERDEKLAQLIEVRRDEAKKGREQLWDQVNKQRDQLQTFVTTALEKFATQEHLQHVEQRIGAGIKELKDALAAYDKKLTDLLKKD